MAADSYPLAMFIISRIMRRERELCPMRSKDLRTTSIWVYSLEDRVLDSARLMVLTAIMVQNMRKSICVTIFRLRGIFFSIDMLWFLIWSFCLDESEFDDAKSSISCSSLLANDDNSEFYCFGFPICIVCSSESNTWITTTFISYFLFWNCSSKILNRASTRRAALNREDVF